MKSLQKHPKAIGIASVSVNVIASMGCVAAPMSLSELPRRGLRVAIFGSTEFHGAESRRLCELLGAKLAQRCGTQLVLLTGGNAVVHEVFEAFSMVFGGVWGVSRPETHGSQPFLCLKGAARA